MQLDSQNVALDASLGDGAEFMGVAGVAEVLFHFFSVDLLAIYNVFL
jgi:hypothetical protein